ncbi:MAG: hypothetical protein ABI843_16805, partial [Dokdonella sp.]
AWLSRPERPFGMAVLFLGGLYLRRHAMFLVFIAVAVAIDWISIDYAGVSSFCVTPAYAFLLPAYAALWYSGRAYAERLRETPASMACALGVALLCAAASFAISNSAFYWLGGRYANPQVGEYLARLWQWGPLFVSTTLCYIALALAAHAILAWTARARFDIHTS